MSRSSQNYNTAIAITIGIFMFGGLLAYQQGGVSPVHVTATSLRSTNDDPTVTVAKAKAKSSMASFIAVIQAADPQHRNFSVLIAVDAAHGTQGLWVHDVTYEKGQFTGILTKLEPDSASMPPMERISVPTARVIDWFYLDGETIVGSYLLRAMRSQLSTAERNAHNDKTYANLGARF